MNSQRPADEFESRSMAGLIGKAGLKIQVLFGTCFMEKAAVTRRHLVAQAGGLQASPGAICVDHSAKEWQ